jgi:hypothetical protein
MKCPQCGKSLVCGCSACKVNFPATNGEVYLEFLLDGECEKCTNCGYTLHADGWLDVGLNELKAEGKWPILVKDEFTFSKENK